jgi:hypothetical protein
MSEQHEPSSSTKPDTQGDDASKKAKNGAVVSHPVGFTNGPPNMHWSP